MTSQYLPVIIMFALSGFVVATFLGLGWALSPRNRTAVKLTTFECGNEPSGSAGGRFSVKFYLTAIIFIIFDVEVVFMYPWAVLFRKLGWFGFVEMAVFIGILVIGLLYVWRRGALEWE